jgi:hypothetical protein
MCSVAEITAQADHKLAIMDVLYNAVVLRKVKSLPRSDSTSYYQDRALLCDRLAECYGYICSVCPYLSYVGFDRVSLTRSLDNQYLSNHESGVHNTHLLVTCTQISRH